MPNTKSAERRMRNSLRKQGRNKSIKSRLKTLETKFTLTIKSGKKEDVDGAFRSISSALDKAAKNGVIHQAMANRKKSRLASRVNQIAK